MIVSALVTALLLVPEAGGPAERPVSIPAAGGVALSGSLLVPAGPGPFPAAVLVSGFGPQRRDGGGAYRRLATALAARGLVVLRYDKRGVGNSGGDALSWPGAGHLLQVEGRIPLRVLDAIAAFAT